jgi:DnaJ-class molecular chaperone
MRGQDLMHAVEISALQAMLGASVKIPSHEGEREIELPPGVQHGVQFALRGHGLPGSSGGPPGDLRIVIHVIVPTDLSDEQRELAEKLEETLEARNLRSQQEDDSFFSRMRRAFG